MKAFSKLDTGVAPHDQRHIDKRLSELLHVVDTPREERAVDYAPPDVRAAAYHVDMKELASEIAAMPLDDLKRQCQRLTYGEMMECCAGILDATGNKPISSKEELAAVINQWARS